MADTMPIWVVECETNTHGKGIAIVVAPSASAAQTIVKSQGRDVGERTFISTIKIAKSSVDVIVSDLILETYTL